MTVFAVIGSAVQADYYSELRQLQSPCSYMLSVPKDWSRPFFSSDDDVLMNELRESGYSITTLLKYNSESVLRFCARRQHLLREQYLADLSKRIQEKERRLWDVEWRIQQLNDAVKSRQEFDKLFENAEAGKPEETPDAVAVEMKALAIDIIRGSATFSDFEARFSSRAAPLEMLEPLRIFAGDIEYLQKQIDARLPFASAISEELEQLREEHRTVSKARMISY